MNSIGRKIPATMATQHPDNANTPFWDKAGHPFVGVHKEIPECVVCFEELQIDEFMWDWEGKHADAAVIDRLFTTYYDYFKKNKLGEDKFLTFRIPNIWEEKGYSLLQAMTVILTSEDFARDIHFSNRPLFEVILPMTENAEQLLHMHTLFQKLSKFKSKEFTAKLEPNTEYLEMIPLVESVESQLSIRPLLDSYVNLHKKHFGFNPKYIRPFLARSDPALMSGLLATVIANKIALSQIYEFSESVNIPVFPISGVGSLPFRGGLSPSTIQNYLDEFPGMRTVSIQSSFRYDHSLNSVKRALKTLEEKLPATKPKILPQSIQDSLTHIALVSSENYQSTLNTIAIDLQTIFSSVPRRRDRRQHIGLLSYGRNIGAQKLPRAITFTSGFYTIGVPPEFIGIGRTLASISAKEKELLFSEYKTLKEDLVLAGHYLNKDNLATLAHRNSAWKKVQEDIQIAEKMLNLKFGPKTHQQKVHKNLSANALLLQHNKQALTPIIEEMAKLRRSLG